MCNCGSKINTWQEDIHTKLEDQTTTVIPENNEVMFQYTGNTSLTVKGPVTRTIYHFQHKDALVPIDKRDAPAMMAVGMLVRKRD